MDSNITGIKSITTRLKSLEDKLDNDLPRDKFEDKMLSGILKSKEQRTKNELNKIKQHYIEGLQDNHIGEFKNIFKIIEYTVLWIEKNIGKIALLMNTIVTGEFKLQTAVTLITELIDDVDLDFLEESIGNMVEILFNRNKKASIESKPSIKTSKPKHKSGCFSFKRKTSNRK